MSSTQAYLPLFSELSDTQENPDFQRAYLFIQDHKAILRHHPQLPKELFDANDVVAEHSLHRFIEDHQPEHSSAEKTLGAELSLGLAYTQVVVSLYASPDTTTKSPPSLETQKKTSLAKQLGSSLGRPKLSFDATVGVIFSLYQEEAYQLHDFETVQEEEFTAHLIKLIKQGLGAIDEVIQFFENCISEGHRFHLGRKEHTHRWKETLDAIAPNWWLQHVAHQLDPRRVHIFLDEDTKGNLPRPNKDTITEAVLQALHEEQTRQHKQWDESALGGDAALPFVYNDQFGHMMPPTETAFSDPYRAFRPDQVERHALDRFDLISRSRSFAPFCTHAPPSDESHSQQEKSFFGLVLEFVFVLGASLKNHPSFKKLLWDRSCMDPIRTKDFIRYLRVYHCFPELLDETPEKILLEVLRKEWEKAQGAPSFSQNLMEELSEPVTLHASAEKMTKQAAYMWQMMVREIRHKAFEQLGALCDHQKLRDAVKEVPVAHRLLEDLLAPWRTSGVEFFFSRGRADHLRHQHPNVLVALPFVMGMLDLQNKYLRDNRSWLSEADKSELEKLVDAYLQKHKEHQQEKSDPFLLGGPLRSLPQEIHNFISAQHSFALWLADLFPELPSSWTDEHIELLCEHVDQLEKGLSASLASALQKGEKLLPEDEETQRQKKGLLRALKSLEKRPEAFAQWTASKSERLAAFLPPQSLVEHIHSEDDFLRLFPEASLTQETHLLCMLYKELESSLSYPLSAHPYEVPFESLSWTILQKKLPEAWAIKWLQRTISSQSKLTSIPCARTLFKASLQPQHQVPPCLVEQAEQLLCSDVEKGALYIEVMYDLWHELKNAEEATSGDKRRVFEATWDKLVQLPLDAEQLQETEHSQLWRGMIEDERTSFLYYMIAETEQKAAPFYLEILRMGLRKEETLDFSAAKKHERKCLPPLVVLSLQLWLLGSNANFARAAKHLLQQDLMQGARTVGPKDDIQEPLAVMLATVIDELLIMQDKDWLFEAFGRFDTQEYVLLLLILRELGVSKVERVIHFVSKRAKGRGDDELVGWINRILGENRSLLKESRFRRLPRRRLRHFIAIGGFLNSLRQGQKPTHTDKRLVKELITKLDGVAL